MEAENNTRISVHEAVCAERYKRIEESFERGSKRMARIEYMLYALIVITFFGKDTFMQLLQTVIVK
jgi:predicted nucleic acid-binding Zn ribbon protein